MVLNSNTGNKKKEESIVVSIIIVTYNSENDIVECVNSVRRQNIPCEIFIVDNASTDNTREVILEMARDYDVIKPIFNVKNMGLAYANNQPLDMCAGEYILILNPDTILYDSSLNTMMTCIDKNDAIGIVGPKSYFDNGKAHISYHYNWTISHVILWRFFPSSLVRYMYDQVFGKYKEGEVMFVSGACLLIKTWLFRKVNGYDINYFLAIEDVVDLCTRVKKLGYSTHYCPSATVMHIGGNSNRQAKLTSLHRIYQGALYHIWKYKGETVTLYARYLLVINLYIRRLISFALIPFDSDKYRDRYSRYKIVISKIKAEDFADMQSTHI